MPAPCATSVPQSCVPTACAAAADRAVKMKSPVKKPAFRLAFCGIMAALGVVLMLITSLIPVGTYAFPMIAGALLVPIVIEFGVRWALGVYAVVALLSFFIAGDKEAVLYVIMLFGYYPVLKNLIESKIKSRPVGYIIKLAVFNAAATGAFFIASFLLAIPPEEYTLFGIYMPAAFLLFGNLLFILYDFALNSFIVLYVRRLRDKLFGSIK